MQNRNEEEGIQGFYEPRRGRGSTVITEEVADQAQQLLNAGTSRTEEITGTKRPVVNPARRKLDRQRRSVQSKLTRRQAEYAAVALHPEANEKKVEQWALRKAELLDEVQQLEHKLETVKAQQQETPSHLEWNELPEESKFERLSPSRKQLLDTVRMIAYRAETAIYWIGHSPHLSGTFLMGARYVRLTEDFVFRSRVDGPPEQALDYYVSTGNDLVGFQIGGDTAICLLQGLRVVGEGKAGIYNNRTKQRTFVTATTIVPEGLSEAADGNNVAFVGEGSLMVVADILPSFSFRAGYQVLVLQSVALAGNNFNTALPSTIGTRTPMLEDQGKALYHGFTAGVEYIW